MRKVLFFLSFIPNFCFGGFRTDFLHVTSATVVSSLTITNGGQLNINDSYLNNFGAGGHGLRIQANNELDLHGTPVFINDAFVVSGYSPFGFNGGVTIGSGYFNTVLAPTDGLLVEGPTIVNSSFTVFDNTIGRNALSVYGYGNGGFGNYGELAWFNAATNNMLGQLSDDTAGIAGDFFLFGDSTITPFIGEWDVSDRSSTFGDQRIGGLQFRQWGDGSFGINLFGSSGSNNGPDINLFSIDPGGTSEFFFPLKVDTLLESAGNLQVDNTINMMNGASVGATISGTTSTFTVVNISTLTITSWFNVPSMTLTQIQSAIPPVAGTVIYCSNCTTDGLVVSTGTTKNAWARVTARTTAPN